MKGVQSIPVFEDVLEAATRLQSRALATPQRPAARRVMAGAAS